MSSHDESLVNNDTEAGDVFKLYQSFLKSPDSVDEKWRQVFGKLDEEAQQYLSRKPQINTNESYSDTLVVQDENIAVFQSVLQAYRDLGHYTANLDPLGLQTPLSLDELKASAAETDTNASAVSAHYEKDVPSTLGVQYNYIEDKKQKDWLENQLIEQVPVLTADFAQKLLACLMRAEQFEQFLHNKFAGVKRFSLEGGEGLIVCLEQLIQEAAVNKTHHFVLGMAHRGRLNVLANILHKPMDSMIAEFMGKTNSVHNPSGTGDVKYHLGFNQNRDFDKHKMQLTLMPNPSHLEAVNTVLVGYVRALQDEFSVKNHLNIISHQHACGILVHGDAAFSGQGVVPETLCLSQLPGYTVGGTVHVVVNNQIGFTTSPELGRSSAYCTDVAKMIQAPVIHVNGADAEAVARAATIAFRYRSVFGRDVVIDLVCSRKYGHNEIDEPSFTQPKMYQTVRAQASARKIFEEKILKEKILPHQTIQQMTEKFTNELKLAYVQAQASEDQTKSTMQLLDDKQVNTGFSPDVYGQVASSLIAVPAGFKAHKRLRRVLVDKQQRLEIGKNLDWGTAEALALGSLLVEGRTVRMSGQDCERGTFSHRHAVFIDQDTEQRHVPLNHINDSQAYAHIINSPLSEFGVLGFEYGYSMQAQEGLTIWEAQFGDFANGAQVIIDQFISSAETKWGTKSSVVMLLPHGYEGQGPEHSSARLERFLQMSAEDNWRVLNCSTPASYFHALRRQIHDKDRKPLIVMSPKKLLRLKAAVSNKEEFLSGTAFMPVIDDPDVQKHRLIKRIILCSGKVYYDLKAANDEHKSTHTAIIRIEQFYPFPEQELQGVLAQYSSAIGVIWCQEEHKNMGGWHFVDRRIENILQTIGGLTKRPVYVGRKDAAATATGYASVHEKTQIQLVECALRYTKSTKIKEF